MALGDHAILTWPEVQARLSLESDDQLYVEPLIDVASRILESEIKGQIKARPMTVYLDGNGLQELLLPDYPVTGTVELYIDSSRVFGTETRYPGFVTEDKQGILWADTAWPKGKRNIKAIFSPGFNPVPDDLKDACMRLVQKAWADYKLNRAGVKASTGMDGARTEYDIGIPLDVRKVIDNYRKEST